MSLLPGVDSGPGPLCGAGCREETQGLPAPAAFPQPCAEEYLRTVAFKEVHKKDKSELVFTLKEFATDAGSLKQSTGVYKCCCVYLFRNLDLQTDVTAVSPGFAS